MSPHDHDLQAAADEARLTAYALGEVSGDEAATIAARVAADPDARRIVEEVRAVAALLSEGIGAGEPAGLADAQRAVVMAEADKVARRPRLRLWPAAVAAAAIVGLGLLANWAESPRYGLDINGGQDLAYAVGWGPSTNAQFGAQSEDFAELPTSVQFAGDDGRTVRLAAATTDYSTVTIQKGGTLNVPASSAPTIRTTGDFAGASIYGAGSGAGGGHGTAGLAGGAPVPGGGAGSVPVLGDTPVIGGRITTRDEPVVAPGAVIDFTAAENLFDGATSTSEWEQSPPGAASAIVTIAGGLAADGDFRGGNNEQLNRLRLQVELLQEDIKAEGEYVVDRGYVQYSQIRPVLEVKVARVVQELGQALAAEQAKGAAADPRVIALVRNSVSTLQPRLDGAANTLQAEVVALLAKQKNVQAGNLAADAAEVAELHRALADRQRELAGIERLREISRSLQYPGGEAYEHPGEARFRNPRQEPLSTFSIDVDTASYANVRRFLRDGVLPPAEAVRLEEMINYFDYDYTPPESEHPVAATIETASCPWNTSNRLVRIGLRARDIVGEAPPANLVFLIDVSGSMQPSNKLPLVQQSLRMLVDQMREQDRIAIVTYASGSGVRLASTTGDAKDAIRGVIDGLTAGGSTNGGAGIQDAYRIAAENLFQGGTNRVVLATDGDFNVGVTDKNALIELVAQQAKSGVFLSVLGVGTGNIKDATLEQIADKGNGNYAYLDSLQEARKVLVDEMMGTLVAVAKDVKVQVEFNPLEVQSYRMIGYENRVLATQDFDDDTKDAGEMGASHTVTMLYEIVPTPGATAAPLPRNVEELRYQRPPMEATEAARTGEIMTLKFRYKQPDANESVKLEVPVRDAGAAFDAASADFRFASAVASFGMLLRRSPTAQGISWDGVLELASGSLGEDPKGRRTEMLDLVRDAKRLSGN